jgi:carbon-monoxide dehydrogenase large subunit
MTTTFTKRAYTSFVGRPVFRREDARMLGGGGRFTDDIQPPGVTYAAVLRSSYSHALIRSIDIRPYTGVRLG